MHTFLIFAGFALIAAWIGWGIFQGSRQTNYRNPPLWIIAVAVLLVLAGQI